MRVNLEWLREWVDFDISPHDLAEQLTTWDAGLNLFVMEHIPRVDLGRSEPLRMLSVGVAWTVGPMLGVGIETLWAQRVSPAHWPRKPAIVM